MKNKYLYQGWAGNTYSHKCKDTNENTTSTIEYLDMRDIGYSGDIIVQAALFAKLISDSISTVAPSGIIYPLASSVNGKITHLGVDWNMRIVTKQNDTINDLTALEYILSKGIAQEELDAIPRITKEEFYNLEA